MRTPKCCGSPMDRWTEDGKQFWHCHECDRLIDLYRRPMRWVWLTVRRRDLFDNQISIPWWLGNVASLRKWHEDTLTFTVIPFNVIINLVASVLNWFRYCSSDRWMKELEKRYNQGYSDGRGNVRVEVHKARAEARAEAIEEFRVMAKSDDAEWRRMVGL